MDVETDVRTGSTDGLLTALNWVVVVVASAGLLGTVAWIVADQYAAECTAEVPPSAHAAQECVQHQVGAVVFLSAALAGALLLGVASLTARSLLTREGVHRRELFRDRLYPWSDIQAIRVRRGSGSIAPYRVEAVRADGGRAVLLGQFAGEAPAAAWAASLTQWLADGPATRPDRD